MISNTRGKNDSTKLFYIIYIMFAINKIILMFD